MEALKTGLKGSYWGCTFIIKSWKDLNSEPCCLLFKCLVMHAYIKNLAILW